MNEWVFYRGGPKDGKIDLGKHDAGFLVFDPLGKPRAYYRLTDVTINTDRGRIPVADYIGDRLPDQESD